MYNINNQRAFSLGFKESAGGEYKGEKTNPYFMIRFATKGDGETKVYLSDEQMKDEKLKGDIRKICEWGKWFCFDGSITSKGKIAINAVRSDFELEED